MHGSDSASFLERLEARMVAASGPRAAAGLIAEAVEAVVPHVAAAVFIRCAPSSHWQELIPARQGAVEALKTFAMVRSNLADGSSFQSSSPRSGFLPLVTAERVVVGCVVLVARDASEIGFVPPHPLREIAGLATTALTRSRAAFETARRARWGAAAAALPRLLHTASTPEALMGVIERSVGSGIGGSAVVATFDSKDRPRPLTAQAGAAPSSFDAVARQARDLDRIVVARPAQVEILPCTVTQAAAAPLHDLRDAGIGALCVEIPIEGTVYAEEDLAQLAELADVIALALDLQTTRRNARIAQKADPETGCLAADALLPAIAAALDSGRARHRETALLVLQIDRRDGPIDPKVARSLGERLAETAGPAGLEVSRTRPWQFTIIAPDHSLREAQQLAQRLRLLAKTGLPDGLAATASVGIAQGPAHGSDAETLRAAADAALDAALATGPDADAVARGTPLARPTDSPGVGERLEMLRSLARLVDDIHFNRQAHGEAVAQRARTLAAVLQFTRAEIESLTLAGELHDIGRCMLPHAIFAERRPNAQTLAMIKSHVVLGSRLIQAAGFPRTAEAVGAMHEYWDGTGSPAGLGRERIPIGGRVLAIANAFETILNNLGRDLNGYTEAARHIATERGRMFDPQVVEILLRDAGAPNEAD